ncbi:MAG: outer membrane protein assembly factor BamB family protein [Caulobacteraceae bacterium]
MATKAVQLTAAAAICAGIGTTVAFAQNTGAFTGQAYNDDAAARGQVAYAQNCGRCHGANLAGGEFGPSLTNAVFAGHWQGQTGGALVTYVQTRMPPGGAGTLPADTYADLAAYLMKANGAAPGAAAAPTPAPASARQTRTGLETRAQPKDAETLRVEAARKAKLDAIKPVTDAMLANPPEGDWLMWRRTYGVSGFSKLKQITKANVAQLRPAWSWNIPVSQNETTPLVHDGVLFVMSGGTVQALDGVTGDLLWRYVRPILPTNLNGGVQHRNKGLAIWGDKLIADTVDKHVVALDVHTGKVVWDHEIAGPDAPTDPENVKPQTFGVPIVADGKVVVGVSLAIDTPSGNFIVALDANTGQEIWRFKTVAQPGQPGGDSWNGAPPSERYGAGVWTGGSYDPSRKLVFFGTGNTYDAGTLLLPQKQKGESNDALYTDTTLALDVETGKLAWHYQHMQRDVWDMDWVFEQSLATLPVDGKPRDVVLTAGKLAIFDVMDRATGQYLFSKDLGLQNLVTAIDPKTGKKTTNPALEPVSGKPLLLCPSSAGARSWPTTALDPESHIVYVPMVETCTDYTWTARDPAAVAKGGLDMAYPARRPPDSDGKFGRLEAIDLVTRKPVWTVRRRAGVTSSVLGLSTGVVFAGSMDRMFHAYDAKTGKVLWETRLSASPNSSPITYAVNGEQYVAVVAGGGGAFDSAARPFTPEIDAPAPGVTVVVFKLPKAAGKRSGR